MKLTRTLPTTLAVVVLLASLSGCAVALTDPNSDEAPESAVETQTQDEQAPEDQPAAEEESAESNSGPTQWSAEVDEQYQRAITTVSKTVSCDGELVLGDSETGQIVRVDGPCEHLVLDMDAGAVVAEEVMTLDIRGSGNIVFVDAATTLNVTGDANVTYWLGTSPSVNDNGVGNALTAG